MVMIALSGYARSGKDTAADVLVDEFGFRRIAFADKVREALYELNPIVAISKPRHCSETLREGWEPMPGVTIYLQDVIDRVGWDGYKKIKVGPEIRRLLQRLGTEAGRGVLGEDIWVDAALDEVSEYDKVVITDCRFPNEASNVVRRGGFVWRINRLGVGPANEHFSERAVDSWPFDFTIHNDGSLEEFCDKVRTRLERPIVLQ